MDWKSERENDIKRNKNNINYNLNVIQYIFRLENTCVHSLPIQSETHETFLAHFCFSSVLKELI